MKCHVAVRLPSYVGITMAILLSRRLLFQKQWMVKVKVAVFKMNKNHEYCQKQTLWYSYVFDHKVRTIYYLKTVDPILELRKIG